VAGKTPKEAAENLIHFLQETVSCISDEWLTAFQQSSKLFKVWTNPPFELKTKSGAMLSISVTQVFAIGPHPTEARQFKAKTREYSYLLSQFDDGTWNEIVAYHWHPNDFAVRYPHLHVRCVPRVHFPTSRVCLEDFIVMAIRYYECKPIGTHAHWSGILEKNKKAFEKLASWKIQHPL
jgi:hypothetical protein